MKYKSENISKKNLLTLYKGLLLPRMIEEKMLLMLRQGQFSKWFSGIGQEAISVGVTAALGEDDHILTLHRNLGVFTTRNVSLYRLFCQWQGKGKGYTQGRDRSFHFGSKEDNIVGMISHLGPQLGVACGIALGYKLSEENNVCAVFTGEGGTSQGDFHEALNVASVWDLPVLFCIENNGYGLSTPANEQFKIKNLADRGKAYIIESHVVDGNNIIDVFKKVRSCVRKMKKNPRPIIIEFKTFRMRGHEEASGQAYIDPELISEWKAKDPLTNYIDFLKAEKIILPGLENKVITDFKSLIDSEWIKTKATPEVEFDAEKELKEVYQTANYKALSASSIKEELRFVDAIAIGLDEAMQADNKLILMGQDIATYGGVFKITDGLFEKFGADRVRNTPLCESVILSAAYGLTLKGYRVMVEMQFSDFVSSGFTAVVNLIAKSHYRWGHGVPVVIRMPCGGGVQAGPFHSQSNESWFTTVPGLKVVYPAFPTEAKGLLTTALKDPNPVLFFEHKKLYRTVKEAVPKNRYSIAFGKAVRRSHGQKLTIICYGLGVHWALEQVDVFPEDTLEIIDLNTLVPWDQETVFEAVRKTGRVLLLQEDSSFGGYMGEMAAQIGEHCFESLDAPVRRLGSLDTPIPFTAVLEAGYLPKNRLQKTIQEMLNY